MAPRYIAFVSREGLRYCAATLGSAWIVTCISTVVRYAMHADQQAGSWRQLIGAIVRSGGRLSVVLPLYCAAFVVAYLVIVAVGHAMSISRLAIRAVAAVAFVALTMTAMVGAAMALYVEFGGAGFGAAVVGSLWYSLRGMRIDPDVA